VTIPVKLREGPPANSVAAAIRKVGRGLGGARQQFFQSERQRRRIEILGHAQFAARRPVHQRVEFGLGAAPLLEHLNLETAARLSLK